MKKRIWVPMLIAGILLFSLSQNAKGDDRRALAEELLNVKQMQKTMEGSLAAIKQMIISQIKVRSKGQDVSADIIAMMDKMFSLISDERGWDKVKNDYISVYADTYTEEELKVLIDFYKSSDGQAVSGKESELFGKVVELNLNRMIQIMPKIQAKLSESTKDRGSALDDRSKCITNLKQLGLAVHMFAQDNSEKFPENLVLLQSKGYISSSELLVCPGYKTVLSMTPTGTVARSSYIYVKGLSEKDDPQALVIYDASADNHGGQGRNILFVDGHVEYRPEESFQALLQKFMTGYKDRITLVEVGTALTKEPFVAEPKKSDVLSVKGYGLSPNEDLKYINPSLREEKEPASIFFRWSEGKDLSELGQTRDAADIRGVLRTLADIYPQGMEGDQELLSAKMPGDFVIRAGTSPDKIVVRLEEVLRRDLKLPVRLVFRDVERKVIAAQGTFRITPLSERRPNRIEIYGANLNQDPNSGGGGSGDFQLFLKGIGMYLDRRVVGYVKIPNDGSLEWHYNDENGGSKNIGLVLQHLTEQTGLTFKDENRLVRVLFVERDPVLAK